MSGKKSLIINQLTNLIICLIIAIPVEWLLEKENLCEVSKEYFMPYYSALLFIGLLLAAVDRVKMTYYGAAVLPTAVAIVFRDTVLFFNCFTAFIVFSLICILFTHGLGIIVPFNPPIKGLFDPKSPILLATY